MVDLISIEGKIGKEERRPMMDGERQWEKNRKANASSLKKDGPLGLYLQKEAPDGSGESGTCCIVVMISRNEVALTGPIDKIISIDTRLDPAVFDKAVREATKWLVDDGDLNGWRKLVDEKIRDDRAGGVQNAVQPRCEVSSRGR